MVIITEGRLIRHELIGLDVAVVRSTNPLQMGIRGVVVDETKNTLIIANNSKKRCISKEDAVFSFAVTDERAIEVDGRKLLGRPVDRTRRIMRGSRR